MKRSIKECMDILECSIGEVEYQIPSDVLEQTIEYLLELKEKRVELKKVKTKYKEIKKERDELSLWKSFTELPDEMGRW